MSRSLLCVVLCSLAVLPARAEVTETPVGGFAFTMEAVVPGAPDHAYDEFTGDVSGWWDHTMSEDPARLVIDARPGGTFHEHFDEDGDDGAVHARVIYAERGRKLVMDGPLGFNGHPLSLVITVEFEVEDASRTRVRVTCRGAGQLEEGWAEAVEGVWHHFLVERYKPWMEGIAAGG